MPASCGADQSAEALLELDDRLGQLVVAERIAAGGSDGLEAGFQQRAVGHAERERVMITFCRASPGTSTPCQKLSVPNSTPRGFSLNSSSILPARHAVRLAVQGQVPFGQPRRQSVGGRRRIIS